MLRHALLISCCLLLAVPALAGRSCGACQEEIGGRYLELRGESFCSRACLRTTLPPCHACSAPVEQGMKVGERFYCRSHSELGACGSCGYPAVDARRLGDGRVQCAECWRVAVDDLSEALPLYRRAARRLETITGLDLGRLPKLELVSQPELLERGRGQLTKASLGLYRSDRRVSLVDGREAGPVELRNTNISMLTHLREESFEAAVTHELAHHLLALHFLDAEEQGPAWFREGVAEYLAAISCRRAGRSELAESMRQKEPPYGTGLRFMEERFGEDGWPALQAWLERVDARRLPQRPPGVRVTGG